MVCWCFPHGFDGASRKRAGVRRAHCRATGALTVSALLQRPIMVSASTIVSGRDGESTCGRPCHGGFLGCVDGANLRHDPQSLASRRCGRVAPDVARGRYLEE